MCLFSAQGWMIKKPLLYIFDNIEFIHLQEQCDDTLTIIYYSSKAGGQGGEEVELAGQNKTKAETTSQR